MNKMQTRANFLFQFKLGRKANETAHDINNAFGSETAKERHNGSPRTLFYAETAPKEGYGDCGGQQPVSSATASGRRAKRLRQRRTANRSTKHEYMCMRLVNMKEPILQYDNARLHISMMTRRKLNDLGYETLAGRPPLSQAPRQLPAREILQIPRGHKNRLRRLQRLQGSLFLRYLNKQTRF